MRRYLTILTILAALCGAPAAAQEVQPPPTAAVEMIEIEYDGVVIEIDPADGPVQCLVVWRRGAISDLHGEQEPAHVRAVIFADHVGAGWIAAAVIEQPAVGAWDLQPEDDCTEIVHA